MSETVTLRTMARKSVIDWPGRYTGRSIQQMLDLKNYRALRWYYYNYSKITYQDDILEEIGITDRWRIAKPGTDPELNEKLNEWKEQNVTCYLGRLSDENAKEAYAKGGKVKKKIKSAAWRRYRDFKRKDNRDFSKGEMQSINHGHKPNFNE